jgi:tyrosyl-tRNA synthetase
MDDIDYWEKVISIGKASSLSREEAMTIMGRTEDEVEVDSSKMLALMQAADIFAMDLDVAYSGLTRRAYMLARMPLLLLRKPTACTRPCSLD